MASAVEDRGLEAAPAFGALLRRYRHAAGLSQEALAERARLSLYGISALERGYRRTPQRETLELLVEALALSEQQRREFEASATRASSPRRRSEASITVGPWPGAPSADLPLALTRFMGRGAELEEIAVLLRENRLVTVTGAGGIGKTQTALRAVTAANATAGTPVCFVNLASVADAALIAAVIAGALGVQEVPNHPLLETLVAFLRNKSVILIFDNCEHVIVEAAIVADFLLRGCPNVRVLATSREPLKAAGERTYRLPSLDRGSAVALFADRARAADPHFPLTSQNEPIVAAICERLCGIPLAIELAAARVTVLPLSLLTKELDDHLGILAGGGRSAPPRQQTMRAAIDWSYELLTESEKRLFERLSIFVGGCTLDAARVVCQGGDVAADDIFSLISSLINKSLVLAELEEIEPRYRLLEPFREYAREKLRVRGEEAEAAHRHVLACLDLAADYTLRDQHYTIYYRYPRDEIGNWRAAIRWALTERNDVEAAQRLVAEVVFSWSGTTPLIGDARRWISAALALADEETHPEVVAKLNLANARLAMHLDKHALQLESAKKSVAYYREAGDGLNLSRSLMVAGNALIDLGCVGDAVLILEEGLALAREFNPYWDTINLLRQLGYAYRETRDFATSRAFFTEASQLLEFTGDQVDTELTISDFAALDFAEGNPQAAVSALTDLFARGLDPLTPRRLIALAELCFSEYLIALGRYEEAQKYASQALVVAREEHMDVYAASALGLLATIAISRPFGTPNVHAKAALILGFVEARLRALGSSGWRPDLDVLSTLRGKMGEDSIAKLGACGANTSENEAADIAVAL